MNEEKTLFNYELFCRSWKNCSANVQREGPTYCIFAQVESYSRDSVLYWYGVNQQRYNESIDSVHHLCSYVEPGTYSRYSVTTAYNKVISALKAYSMMWICSY